MLEMNIPRYAGSVLHKLTEAGFEAYLVGGCVRDRLMGREPHDYDIASAALPEQVIEVFGPKRVIKTGIKHGTVTVISGRHPIEVTTFRTDGEYLDNRRPKSVTFVSELESDLSRRDFTVNAMAWSTERGLVDLFGGEDDLKKGIIRCVGQPEKRFNEDGLRIMRALRFASRLDFSIDPQTAQAIHNGKGLLDNISAERLFIELKGILVGQGVEKVLTEYSDVLFQIMPELEPMTTTPQHNPHHIYDVWQHTVKSVAAAPPEELIRLTMLFHDSGKPACLVTDGEGIDHFYGHPKVSAEIGARILANLKSDNRTKRETDFLVRKHDQFFPRRERRVMQDIVEMGEQRFLNLMKVKYADAAAHAPASRDNMYKELRRIETIYKRMKADKIPFSIGELAVTGEDLIAAGVPKGKPVGRTLEKLFRRVVIGELKNDRETLLGEVRKKS